jgi:hypothetical protein
MERDITWSTHLFTCHCFHIYEPPFRLYPLLCGRLQSRCVLSSLKTNGKPGNRRPGLVGGADRDPAHPAVCDVVADLEAEGVAIEGQGCVRVVMREEGRVNRDIYRGHASCSSVTGASRFLIGLVTCFAHARRHPRRRARRVLADCYVHLAAVRIPTYRLRRNWSGRRGSNPRLQPWEGCTHGLNSKWAKTAL